MSRGRHPSLRSEGKDTLRSSWFCMVVCHLVGELHSTSLMGKRPVFRTSCPSTSRSAGSWKGRACGTQWRFSRQLCFWEDETLKLCERSRRADAMLHWAQHVELAREEVDAATLRLLAAKKGVEVVASEAGHAGLGPSSWRGREAG